MEVPIPPSRVITAISVVFLLRFLGTFPQALFPLGALALRRVMEVLKPLSSTNTRRPASKREASHPPQTSRLLVTLGGYLGLFLVGHPPLGRTAIALPMVEVETLCPNSSSKASRCSSRVRSSLASRCFGSHSLSIAPFLEGLPGIGLGSTSPLSRRLLSQRFMVGIDTEKVFATCSLGLPASTAASTLNLRSFEYGFMPGD